jgi:hypothetical protein
MPRGGVLPPTPVLAPGSALGSRPRVALSSARVPPAYTEPRPPAIHGGIALEQTGGGRMPRERRSQTRIEYQDPHPEEDGRRGEVRANVSHCHVNNKISLFIGGLSATGSRSSEATDLSCHLWHSNLRALKGAPTVVSRGTGRGDRSNLRYGQCGGRVSTRYA